MVRKAKSSEEISYYLNLPKYSIRLGLHNLNAANYKGVRNKPKNYSVTIKDPLTKDSFKPNKNVYVKEYVYVYYTKERLKNIAESILHLLETGEWDETIAKSDYTNPKKYPSQDILIEEYDFYEIAKKTKDR